MEDRIRLRASALRHGPLRALACRETTGNLTLAGTGVLILFTHHATLNLIEFRTGARGRLSTCSAWHHRIAPLLRTPAGHPVELTRFRCIGRVLPAFHQSRRVGQPLIRRFIAVDHRCLRPTDAAIANHATGQQRDCQCSSCRSDLSLRGRLNHAAVSPNWTGRRDSGPEYRLRRNRRSDSAFPTCNVAQRRVSRAKARHPPEEQPLAGLPKCSHFVGHRTPANPCRVPGRSHPAGSTRGPAG